MKQTITTVLNFVFPYHAPTHRVSVFMQETWLDRIMQSTQIKDWISCKH